MVSRNKWCKVCANKLTGAEDETCDLCRYDRKRLMFAGALLVLTAIFMLTVFGLAIYSIVRN